MHENPQVTLKTVTDVYDGPEGDLWELLMGQQIHLGGLTSSIDLAEQAGIAAGTRGVDLCCCNGAGMRFLLRTRGVAHMTGVDACATVLTRARERSAAEGFAERTRFVQADVTASGLEGAAADFVWGEDAWCYIVDKERLIAEAARIVRGGGMIAFTDWVEGPAGLSAAEGERFLRFMKFPSLLTMSGYADLLGAHGCRVVRAVDTGRFAACMDLYLNMVGMQLTSDVLRIIGHDQELFRALAGEMSFMQELAHAGKIAQGQFVARKR
ncbi:MAG: methyltransferase domain-containing protein [Planctomycetes bacterium]|nr:methyltransferase domain-containing protein [Planctomycetota bacterium]